VRKNWFVSSAAVILLVLLSSCRTYPDQVGSFRFPILSGDIQRGQESFLKLECNQCHEVNGVALPAFSGPRPVTVVLGGDLYFAKTYGDLVTSIINPDHVLSDNYLEQLPREVRRRTSSSPMYLKEEMLVTELVDIVAFLNSRYSLLPGYTEYYY
jgi:sulfur-oxidizing protein SoxX|tara:strand:- start:906 stop:1370 length:465 start_codon:yes stop_codon:yes gene_type:complete